MCVRDGPGLGLPESGDESAVKCCDSEAFAVEEQLRIVGSVSWSGQ